MTTELARSDDALADRIQMLRSILPTLASEVAVARREAARLRRENVAMQSRIAQLEGGETEAITLPPALRSIRHGAQKGVAFR